MFRGKIMTINIIDLFSGGGGLTEGFRSPQTNIIAHVEMDKNACKTLQLRDSYYYLKKHKKIQIYNSYLTNNISFTDLLKNIPSSILNRTINEEISDKTIPIIFKNIDKKIDQKKIQGIIGGPPCQAYSTIGRAQNEKKKNDDVRIYLYKHYIKFLKKYDPDFFILENVKGLQSFRDLDGKKLLPKILKEFETINSTSPYIVDHKIIDASEYGIPQKRQRLFIFGHKKHFDFNFFESFQKFKASPPTVNMLFKDLPTMSAGEINNNYSDIAPVEFVKKHIRNTSTPLSQNISRPNNKTDLEIYKIVASAKLDGKNIKYSDLPSRLKTHKKTQIFLDRFKAINGNSQSHTVVAHIAKDGHYYIHPDVKQNRSITVREAARIQTFPDNYFFENSRTAAFQQIGNAVPSLLAKKICSNILNGMYSQP